MWLFVAAGSAFVFGLAGLLMKISQVRGGALSSLLLGLYAAGTCGFWAQALWTGSWQPADGRVWLWGAIVGLGSAWGNLLFMKALDCGPASLTSPLTNGNVVIVAAFGVLWFGEPVGVPALAGAALIVAAVIVLSSKSESGGAITDKRWYACTAGAMLLFVFRNGGLKVTDSLGLDSASVLWAGYLLSWAWFALSANRERRRAAGAPDAAARNAGFAWGLAAGVCSYGGLQLYATALSLGPSYAVAPIFAANSLVVAAGSLILYREKLTAPMRWALALLLAGLVLVRL